MTAPELLLSASAPEDEWLALRRSGLGGSDVAAAVGLSPWTTPFQLWLEKSGRVEPDHDERSLYRMRWGKLLEPVLAREFDDRHAELIVTGGAGLYRSADAPWMLATPDLETWKPDQTRDGLGELKTGNHRQLVHWADDQVPLHYVIQVQWYCAVLDAPRAYVAALLDTSTYVERELPRDNALIADLVELAGEFWRYVETDTPPPVDGSESTRRALARSAARAGATVTLDPLWHKRLRQRDELAELIGELAAERDLIDNELRAAMGSAELAELDGRRVATHRAPGKPTRTCRWDELATDHPAVYAAYVAERPPGRRLTYSRSGEDTE